MSQASKNPALPVKCSSMTASGCGLSVPCRFRSLTLFLGPNSRISLLFNLEWHQLSVIQTEVKSTLLCLHHERTNIPTNPFGSRDRPSNNQFGRFFGRLTIHSESSG